MLYTLTEKQIRNVLLLLDRADLKGFKEAEAMMDLWTTIQAQREENEKEG